MACGAKLPMVVSGVTHGDALHELAERLLMNLHQRMQVIGHPAERMQSCKTAAQALSEDVVQNVTVLARRKEILAMVSTQHYMIVAAGHVQSRRARHPCITQKSDQ